MTLLCDILIFPSDPKLLFFIVANVRTYEVSFMFSPSLSTNPFFSFSVSLIFLIFHFPPSLSKSALFCTSPLLCPHVILSFHGNFSPSLDLSSHPLLLPCRPSLHSSPAPCPCPSLVGKHHPNVVNRSSNFIDRQIPRQLFHLCWACPTILTSTFVLKLGSPKSHVEATKA